MDRNPDKCAEWKENEMSLTNDCFGPTFDDISEIYADESVVDHSSAKLIDCCRENKNSCSIVNDIVGDEGVPLKEKILEQTLKKIDNLEDYDSRTKLKFGIDMVNPLTSMRFSIENQTMTASRMIYHTTAESKMEGLCSISNLSPIPALEIHQNLAPLCEGKQNLRPRIKNISYDRLDLSQSQSFS